VPIEEEEFSSPEPNLIVSRHGFSVEVSLPSRLVYAEADRRMDIFAETLVRPGIQIAVRRSDVKAWHGPQPQAGVTEVERSRIIDNIRKAFESRDWILVVEPI